MAVFDEIRDLYSAVHGMPGQTPSEVRATEKGQHEAIWDALLLLAARIDGDMTRNPRGEREIVPDEFTRE